MLRVLLSATLLGVAASSPLAVRGEDTNYPTLSLSKGFNLIVDLVDPTKDFSPPIQNNFITTIHVGAALSQVGVSPDKGRVFYQNGTTQDHDHGDVTTITDDATPPAPAGFKLVPDAQPLGFSTANLNIGPGTPGIMLSGGPISYLNPQRFYACDEPLEYYEGKKFVIIRHSAVGANIPSECREVRLIPQCTELAPLPNGASASHKFALDSRCYKDARSIDWTRYRI